MIKIKHTLLALIIYTTASAQVNQQWAFPYLYTGALTQGVIDMAIDDSGNVVIAGKSNDNMGQNYATVTKISTSGVLVFESGIGDYGWLNYFNTVVLDDSGNIYAGGVIKNQTSSKRSLMAKYNSSGSLIWIDTSDFQYTVFDNVSTSNGEVVTLLSYSNVTIKKHIGNTLVWQTRNDTSVLNSNIHPRFIKADSAGNIYVSGFKVTSDYLYFVKKFDSNGSFLWHSEINPSSLNDQINDFYVDKQGNSYLVGMINSSNSGFEIAKFNTSGLLVWDKQYDTNVSLSTVPKIDVDANGNVYICGSYTESIVTTKKLKVIKYDVNGNFLWSTNLDTMSFSSDSDIALDKQGNVYVTYTKRTQQPSYSNYSTSRLSPIDGSVIWEAIYTGTNDNANNLVKILVDTLGSVYVGGHEVGFATIVKYNQTVGIDENPNDGMLQIYPNPATTSFTIQPRQPFNNACITLYNTLGTMVMQQQNINENKITIQTNELPAGIYFINILNQDKTFTGKIIIE